MALYAFDEDDLIFAQDAETSKTYWCLDCFGPVKRRRGKYIAHFYHTKTTRRCRLYSKSEDHMLVQIQLQKAFPEGALKIERPFLEINRVADLCWEREKIIFEIQCSPMSEKEAEMRIRDYRSLGYEVIWLLDDKRYNKKVLRPAESFLRKHSTYYVSIRQALHSDYYDQFEVFAGKMRVKKGGKMRVDLQKPISVTAQNFDETLFPKQIMELNCLKYFPGSRLHKTVQKQTMLLWRSLEELLKQTTPSPIVHWFNEKILQPYLHLLKKFILLKELN